MARTKTRRETSAGGVVFRCDPGGLRFLLIHDGHGNWGFPKGHIERGEDPGEAAGREVAEEAGLNGLTLHASLATIDWFFRFRGRLIHKYCHLFLFESREGTPVPQADEGIRCCDWLSPSDALETLTHDNARQVLQEAIARVRDLGLCPAASA
ncbi:MAG: NUDIX hydrolase [Gemmatimonadetes bacterium]|nr:NUDIX hydrolase [Gemmatimonadota bacterium]MBI2402590.1 NUDIX hydrolase [Gemmatimonadota bacterium]MBI2537382.1 NUDIX hydrolase [Gemmatimonadota bacterium]MBI2614341.1 NUDIX hydrolase [Gemmatimonadota bacterium]